MGGRGEWRTSFYDFTFSSFSSIKNRLATGTTCRGSARCCEAQAELGSNLPPALRNMMQPTWRGDTNHHHHRHPSSLPSNIITLILARFDTWATEVERRAAPLTWGEDPALPEGWNIAQGLQENSILRDPRGARCAADIFSLNFYFNIFRIKSFHANRFRFGSRKDAIDHLIREHYSPTDIFR